MRCSPRNLSRVLAVLAVSAAALGTAGCSKPSGTITGKVYYQNNPLKGGNVMFATPDGKTLWGEIQEDGTYSIPKVPPGTIKVGVETASLKPKRFQNNAPADAQGQFKKADPAEQAKRYVYIPDKYMDPQNSGKEFTVTGGPQTYDIKLD